MIKPTPDSYVKKETLVFVTIIALIVGFIGGVTFTIYKSSSGLPIHASTQQKPAKEEGDISAEYAAKIFELERRTSKEPDDVDSWTQLGHLYFDSSKYDKAILAYNKSLEIRPDNADVLTDLGVMHRRSGHPEEAIAAFDRAIKVNPHHEIALFNKGIVLMHDLNDKEGAIKAWEELVSMNPNAQTPTGQKVRELIEKVK